MFFSFNPPFAQLWGASSTEQCTPQHVKGVPGMAQGGGAEPCPWSGSDMPPMSAWVLRHHGFQQKFHSHVSRDQQVSALDSGHAIAGLMRRVTAAVAAAATPVVSLWEPPLPPPPKAAVTRPQLGRAPSARRSWGLALHIDTCKCASDFGFCCFCLFFYR